MVDTKFVIRYSLLGLIGGIVAFFGLIALTSLGVVAVELWFSEGSLLHRMSNGTHNLADTGIFFVFIGIAVLVTIRISTKLDARRAHDEETGLGQSHS